MTKMTFAPVTVLLLAACGPDLGSQSALTINPDVVVDPVDRLAPIITIDEGVRGAWIAPRPLTISGRVRDRGTGVSTVLVNGGNVIVDEAGGFTAEVDSHIGLNTTDILAVDQSGNVATQTVSWLAGHFLQAEIKEVPAVQHRMAGTVLHEAAFDVAASLVDQIAPLEIGDAVLAFEDCMVLEGAVEQAAFGPPAVSFTATGEGLQVDLFFSALTVVTTGTADACGDEKGFTAVVTHPSPHLSALVALRADRGALVAEIQSMDLSLDGAIVFSPELQEDLDLHGIAAEDLGLIELVEDAFRVELMELLPTHIEDAVRGYLPSRLSFGELPDLESRTWISDVEVAAEELKVSYTAAFVPLNAEEQAPDVPGWLVSPTAEPVTALATELQQDTSLAALNRALFAYWATDTFSVVQPFPRALSGEKYETLAVELTLPPIVQADGDQLWLALGEVALEYRVGEEGTVRGTYRANIFVPIGVDGIPEGAPQVTVDVGGGQALPRGVRDTLNQVLAVEVLPRIPAVPTLSRLQNRVAVQPTNVAGGQIVEGWVQSGGILNP